MKLLVVLLGGDLSPHSLLHVGKCLHLLHECSELGPPGQIPDPSLTQPMETSVGAQPPFQSSAWWVVRNESMGACYTWALPTASWLLKFAQ